MRVLKSLNLQSVVDPNDPEGEKEKPKKPVDGPGPGCHEDFR
jgi:hypothetical protein